MYCGSKKEKIIRNPGIEEKGIPRLKVKARGQRRATRERSEFQTRKQAADAGSLSAVNASSNPRRISAAVQNRTDTNYVTFYAVINRKGKACTQAAMIQKLWHERHRRQPMRQCPRKWIRENSFRDRELGVHRIETRRLNRPALPAGSRSSRSTAPNISFRFFPLDELCRSGFDLPFALP